MQYTIAVCEVRAGCTSSTVFASTSLAPARRIALSKSLRPPNMTTSFFMPVVSGSCQILLGSVPAMQPAIAEAIAPAAPTSSLPDSAPEIFARCGRGCLQLKDIHKIMGGLLAACRTSGSSSDPLR